MKGIIAVCLVTAVLCQPATSFANLGAQSKNWSWQPSPSPGSKPVPPTQGPTVVSTTVNSFGPTSSGSSNEFTVEPGSSAESAILSLLKSSSNSKDADSFQAEKAKKPSDAEVSALRASAPASAKSSASAISGASSLTIARRPGGYPGYPPYYPPDRGDYFYPPVTRRLVCRVTYSPWKMCCSYTSWWWGPWGPMPTDPYPEDPYPPYYPPYPTDPIYSPPFYRKGPVLV